MMDTDLDIVERFVIRTIMIAWVIFGIASATVMVALTTYAVIDATGAWLPACVFGLSWSAWRRQCDAEEELKRGLPIARVR